MATEVFDLQFDGQAVPMVYNPNEGTVTEPPPEPLVAKEGEEAEERAVGETEQVMKSITAINFPSVGIGAERQHLQITITEARPSEAPPLMADEEMDKDKPIPPDLPPMDKIEYTPVSHTFPMDTTHVHILVPLNAIVSVKYAQTKTVPDPDDPEGDPMEVAVKEDSVEFIAPNSPQVPTGLTISYLGTALVESPVPIPSAAVASTNDGDESDEGAQKKNLGTTDPGTTKSESDD